jgi:hypothetical protein
MSKRFIFEVQTRHILTVDEVWPDGDAPENPTADDALKVFLKYHSYDIAEGMRDWNIDPTVDDVFVTELEEGVTFNGK